MPLTYIERQHLESLIEKYGLDVQEIDDTLTYDENKQHLQELAHQPSATQEQEQLAYLEQMAREVGRSVVTEEQARKLVDLERRLMHVQTREEKIEALKKSLPEIAAAAKLKKVVGKNCDYVVDSWRCDDIFSV